jgi:hypothetical protein
MTRNSITGQVKVLAMIVAIEGLIPDRRARSSENKSAPPLPQADIYPAACPPRASRTAVGLGQQQEKSINHQPDSALAQEDEPGLAKPGLTSNVAEQAPPPSGPAFDPSESAIATLLRASETTVSAQYVPAFMSAPDTSKNNPFARLR